MTKAQKPAQSHIEGILELSYTLQERLLAVPELAATEIEETLRAMPGLRGIYRGQLDGAPVVIRLDLGPGAERDITKRSAEMARVWAYMSEGPFRIARPIHFDPALGLTVTSVARGRPLLHLMRDGTVDGDTAVRLSAQWLRTYATPEMRLARLGEDVWLDRAERIVADKLHPDVAEAADKVVMAMRAMAVRHGPGDCRRSIIHGDLHANNLMLDGSIMTGIDIGGPSRLPLVKDVARFLVAMARSGPPRPGPRRYAVSARDLDCFGEVLELTQEERMIALPFLIGFEIVFRGPDKSATGKQIDRMLRLSRRYLATVKDDQSGASM